MKTVRTQQRRLIELEQQIAAAEARLLVLHAAVGDLRKKKGGSALDDALQEIDRLQDQHSRATQDADSAHAAALQDAVRASEIDALTGLPNRSSMWSRLTHDISIARRQRARLAVYFIDLDGFKQINDQMGHTVGDQLLQHVAGCLRSAMRDSDSVFRLGGDEFVVVVPDIRLTHIDNLAQKISDAINRPFTQNGQLLKVTASIGASLYPLDGDDPHELVRKADAAMYEAKRSADSAS